MSYLVYLCGAAQKLLTVNIRTLLCSSYNNDTRTTIRVAKGGENHSARKRRLWYTYSCPLGSLRASKCCFAAAAEQSVSLHDTMTIRLYERYFFQLVCDSGSIFVIFVQDNVLGIIWLKHKHRSNQCASHFIGKRQQHHAGTKCFALFCLRQWLCWFAAATAVHDKRKVQSTAAA